jgi:hypothetical protein
MAMAGVHATGATGTRTPHRDRQNLLRPPGSHKKSSAWITCTGAGAVDLSVPCPAPPHTLSDTAVCAPLPTNAANTPAHTTRTLGTIERACLCCGDADQVADFTNLENDTHLHNSVDHGVTCWLQRATLFTTEAANTLDNNVYTSRLCSPSGG